MPYVTVLSSPQSLVLHRTNGLPDDILDLDVNGSFGIKGGMNICDVLNILDKENFKFVSQSQSNIYIVYTFYSKEPIQAERVEQKRNPPPPTPARDLVWRNPRAHKGSIPSTPAWANN